MRRRKDDVLIAQFAECADMILSGASVSACLERFPEHAAQLEPMLASMFGVRQHRAAPVRSAGVAVASRASFMNAAAGVQRSRAAAAAAVPWWMKVFTIFQVSGPGSSPFGGPRTRPVALFAILLILFISGIVISGSVTLAANALPGDTLYNVKTTTESVRLFLALDEGTRSQLRKEFGQRRIDEAQAVVERRRPVDNLRLQGTIESFDPKQWQVSGLRVGLDSSSQVEGTPEVGATVVGRMRAPGDGRLILVFAVLQPPLARSQAQELTIDPPAAAPPPAATATPTETPSPVPSPTRMRLPVVLPGMTPFEPTDAPTRTATVTPSRTPRRRLARRPPPAPGRRPPCPRPPGRRRFRGRHRSP